MRKRACLRTKRSALDWASPVWLDSSSLPLLSSAEMEIILLSRTPPRKLIQFLIRLLWVYLALVPTGWNSTTTKQPKDSLAVNTIWPLQLSIISFSKTMSKMISEPPGWEIKENLTTLISKTLSNTKMTLEGFYSLMPNSLLSILQTVNIPHWSRWMQQIAQTLEIFTPGKLSYPLSLVMQESLDSPKEILKIH